MLKSENVRNLDFQSLFHHISCPAILFSAEGSKAAAKPADIIELKKMIPHLQEVHFDGAGHNIRREQFEKYVETVQTFLDTLLS
jgi:pimeloyl-ACP methyl ester carboxylesterase